MPSVSGKSTLKAPLLLILIITILFENFCEKGTFQGSGGFPPKENNSILWNYVIILIWNWEAWSRRKRQEHPWSYRKKTRNDHVAPQDWHCTFNLWLNMYPSVTTWTIFLSFHFKLTLFQITQMSDNYLLCKTGKTQIAGQTQIIWARSSPRSAPHLHLLAINTLSCSRQCLMKLLAPVDPSIVYTTNKCFRLLSYNVGNGLWF